MELVKGITSDHELIELAKRIGIKLDGVYSIQEIKKPLPSSGSYIILLRNDFGVGHWVCQHRGEYFDSMGIGPKTVLGKLKFSEVQYQGTYDEHCGIYCLLWLYCKQKKRMSLLNEFINLDIDVV